MNIILYKKTQVDSTNEVAKKLAKDNAVSGTVVVADEQTAGKGRLGRSFFSPAQKGIYMSIIIKPDLNAKKVLPSLYTPAAAVAVTCCLKKKCGIDSHIKWVNDIYCGGKKVCGILTEGEYNSCTKSFDYVIVGIGINIDTTEFPKELEQKASSLINFSQKKIDKNELVLSIAQEFFTIVQNDSLDFMNEYKQKSCILTKKIDVIENNSTYKAIALDIDQNGHLLIQTPDGNKKTLCSGEVSIRLNE